MIAERRTVQKRRRSRVVAGGVSAPIGIIINFILLRNGVSEMPSEVQMAIFSVTGSVLSVIVLCFEDIRAIILDRIKAQRTGE